MQWARLQADLNVRLRRGAWYRIRELGPLQSLVEVRGQPVSTIVPRPTDAVRLPLSWGDRYAVCPSCRDRQPIDGRPTNLRCRRCKGVFEVGWNERYAPAL